MTNIVPIQGSELKVILKRKKISQAILSDEFGVHRTTITRYFSDDMKMPYDFVVRVAVFAGLELKDLVKSGHIVRKDVIEELETSPALLEAETYPEEDEIDEKEVVSLREEKMMAAEPTIQYNKKNRSNLVEEVEKLEEKIQKMELRLEKLETQKK